jgi:hypothetical protein
MMTPAQMEIIEPSLRLQADIRAYLVQAGLGESAGDVAGEVMHMVLTSDACKPEIAAIYAGVADGGS